MMNRKEVGEGFRAPRRISNCFKDRDEELSFFRDLQKRQKDQVASLLQPVSEEFEEANGNYGLYRMDSGGRKGSGLEFLGESGKNDLNWLKTPPATPLFPSLEMETNGQELVVQRELPIIQPRTRFAANPEGTKTGLNRSTSPIPKSKLPQRHKTPNGRPSLSSLIDKKSMKSAPTMIQTTSTVPDKTKQVINPVVKATIHKESHPNFPASNLSKSMGTEPNSSATPKSKGVSPFVRQKIPGFSDETPPNLRTTNRPASATRGRPTNQNLSTPQKEDRILKIRRQSCSPSVTRGRKLEANGNTSDQTNAVGKARQAGNRAQVLGSRMVDRFMNARISNAEEIRAKIKLNGSMNENSTVPKGEARQVNVKLNDSMNENSGFGRLMSRSSLDMALKHMEFERDGSSSRKHGMVPGRKY
ncbi:uncharacterized protein LOC105172109 [Sesamum indicum]|uniref:Uncharacterized protein LOC105172109 n=1 Tax=Sesamum indicum TaxID=4182 RepID=A0A6I9U4N0_SESIN|nr:uncharacterized protein LOC105172109 [Sesamum indicum]